MGNDIMAKRSLASFLDLASKWLSLDQGSVLIVERSGKTVRLRLHHSPALEETCLRMTVNFDYFSKHFRRTLPSLPIVGKYTSMMARSLNEFYITGCEDTAGEIDAQKRKLKN